jgi:stage V sporulation protein SpoVS
VAIDCAVGATGMLPERTRGEVQAIPADEVLARVRALAK